MVPVTTIDVADPIISTFRRFKDVEVGNGVVSQIAVNFKFHLIPSPTDEYDNPSQLAVLILEAGGRVSENEWAEYEVTILDVLRLKLEKGLHANLDVPNDAYSSHFIYDSIHNFKYNLPPPDLKRYLITPSIYETYDPLRILLQETKWSELSTIGEPKSYSASQIMAKLTQTHYSVNQLQISPSWSHQSPGSSNAITESSQCNDLVLGIPQENNLTKSMPAGTKRKRRDGDEDSDSETNSSELPQMFPSKPKDAESCNPNVVVQSSGDLDSSESEGDNLPEASDGSGSSEPQEELDEWYLKFDGRRLYSLKEDKLIIQKVLHKEPFLSTTGNKLFELMEKSGGFKKRSGISLRNRWRDRILPKLLGENKEQIQKTYGLSRKQLRRLRRLKIKEPRSSDSDSSEEDSLSKKASDDSGSCGTQNLKSNSSNRGEGNKASARRPYSLMEDKLIIQKILHKDPSLHTTGDNLWKQMKKSEDFADRSWESLKSRWLKILPKLLDEDKSQIRKTFGVSREELNYLNLMYYK